MFSVRVLQIFTETYGGCRLAKQYLTSFNDISVERVYEHHIADLSKYECPQMRLSYGWLYWYLGWFYSEDELRAMVNEGENHRNPFVLARVFPVLPDPRNTPIGNHCHISWQELKVDYDG